jgi:hypothetical protein
MTNNIVLKKENASGEKSEDARPGALSQHGDMVQKGLN